MAINKEVGGKKKRKKLSDLAASSDDDCDSGSGDKVNFKKTMFDVLLDGFHDCPKETKLIHKSRDVTMVGPSLVLCGPLDFLNPLST